MGDRIADPWGARARPTPAAPPGPCVSTPIFLDYARRKDFRDRDGAPLVK
jgi:hypothetical protein